VVNEDIVSFDDVEHRFLGSECRRIRGNQRPVLQSGVIKLVERHEIRHVQRTINRVNIVGI